MRQPIIGTLALDLSSYTVERRIERALLRDEVEVLSDAEISSINFADPNFKIATNSQEPIHPLFFASSYGSIECIKYLIIQKHVNPELRDEKGNTFLHYLQSGLDKVIPFLKEQNISLNMLNAKGQAPLHLAIERDFEQTAACLIEAGADLNIRDLFGLTAMNYAEKSNSLSLISKLITAEAEITLSKEMLNRMLLYKLHINALNHTKNSGTIILSGNDNNFNDEFIALDKRDKHITRDIQILIESGASLYYKNSNGKMLINFALEHDNPYLIGFIVKSGYVTDLSNIPLERYVGAIIEGVKLNDISLIQNFAQAGANFDFTIFSKLNSYTILYYALQHNALVVFDFLLSQGMNIDSPVDKLSNTIMHLAVQERDIAKVKFLCQKGAKLELSNLNGESPLHIAVKNGNVDMVTLLLNSGASPNPATGAHFQAEPPLHIALQKEYLAIADQLIKAGADTSKISSVLTPILFRAIEEDDFILIDELIDFGVDINATNINNETPLIFAMKNNKSHCVVELIRHGARIDNPQDLIFRDYLVAGITMDDYNLTRKLIEAGVPYNFTVTQANTNLLHIAAFKGHAQICEYLVSKNIIDLEAQAQGGLTALQLAVEGNYEKVIDVLLTHGARNIYINTINPNDSRNFLLNFAVINKYEGIVRLLTEKGDYQALISQQGGIALLNATIKGFNNIASRLIEKGVKINYFGRHHSAPLHIAINANNEELFNILLDNDVDVNLITRENGKLSPLTMAVVKGNLKFVEALYKKGAFLNYQNAAGDTALTLSISSKHIDITKYLIEKGVNVNLQNIFGISSLHLAVMQNRSEIVEALIKAGSDLNMKDNQGYTPLCMASHPDIARMLIQNGAEVNPTKGACPPLIEAAKDDKLDIVEVLLKNKADIDAIYDGKTALLCAIKANNITIVKKLIFAGARLNLELYKTQPLVHAAVNDREEADYTDDMVECLLEHGVDVIEPDDENYSDYVNSLLDIAKFTDLLLKGKVDSQLFRGIIDDLDENMKIVSIYNFIFLRNEGKLTHFEIYNNLKEVYASLLNLESELSSIQAEATRGFIKSTLSRNIAAIIYNAVKSGLSENDNTTIFLELINEAFKKNIISEENYSNYIEQLDSTILLEGMVYEVVGLPKDNNPIILSFNNNYHEKFKELYKWLREDKNADLFRNLLKQYYNKITDNDTVEQAWNCLINLSAIEFKWDMKLLNDLLQLDVFRANGNISTEENKFKYKKAFIFHCAHPEYGDVNKFLEDEGYLQQIKDACLSEESDTYAAKTFIKLLTKSVLPASIKQKVNVILKEILTEKPELFMEEEFPMRIVKLESDNSLEPNSKKSVDSQDASNDKAEFLTLSEAQDTAIDVAIVDDGFLDVTGVTS